MTRLLLAGAALAAAAFASPALACTIDTCSYTQPVCNTHAVECTDLVPLLGVDCVRTAAGRVCIPNPPPVR
jgi:hypothetical protein